MGKYNLLNKFEDRQRLYFKTESGIQYTVKIIGITKRDIILDGVYKIMPDIVIMNGVVFRKRIMSLKKSKTKLNALRPLMTEDQWHNKQAIAALRNLQHSVGD